MAILSRLSTGEINEWIRELQETLQRVKLNSSPSNHSAGFKSDCSTLPIESNKTVPQGWRYVQMHQSKACRHMTSLKLSPL